MKYTISPPQIVEITKYAKTKSAIKICDFMDSFLKKTGVNKMKTKIINELIITNVFGNTSSG